MPYVYRAYQAARLARRAYGTYQAVRPFFKRNTRSAGTQTGPVRFSRMSNHGTKGSGVTIQHDERRQYRKKRMPKRKRKRWVKFVKKVNAVIDKNLGDKSIVLSATMTQIVTYGIQNYGATVLYGSRGDAAKPADEVAIGSADIVRIMDNENPTAGYVNKKYHFSSAVMDVTFRNTPIPENNETINQIELDLYHYIVIRKTDNFSTPAEIYDDVAGENPPTGAWPSLGLQILGATPFALGRAGYYLRIIKKKKVLLPAYSCTTYQIRDPKNRTFSGEDVEAANSFGIPYVTQGVFWIFRGAPGYNGIGDLVASTGAQLQITCTRAFHYHVNQDNADETGTAITG